MKRSRSPTDGPIRGIAVSRHSLLKNVVCLENDFWQKEVKGPGAALLTPQKPIQKQEARAAKAQKPEPRSRRVTKDDLPELLTFPEVCKALRIGDTSLRALIEEGELEVQPVRGKRMVRASAIMDYLDREKERMLRHG
jgi:excisionase family DNA binding protein